MKILKTVALISLISAGMTTAYAASDGALAVGGAPGTNSTGTFDFTINRQDAVRITGMTDLTIDTSGTATGAQTLTDSVCYYATTSDYSVDINSANDFVLQSVSGDSMDYTVTWTDSVAGTNQTFNDNANTALSPVVSSNTTSEDCGGGANLNATIQVNVSAAQFNGQPVGSYTDTVSVVIALQ